MEQKDKKTISFVFDKSNKALTIPVTGGWGGPSPDGTSVVAHLYVESHAVPSYLTSEIKEDQSVDPNTGERITRGDVSREIQSTLVMSPETAISIGKWLMEKGELALNIRNKK
jgi:hypothetical protein